MKSSNAWIPTISVWLAVGALATFLAFLAGAFQSEPGMETDEAAHFVTSLMVRDYVAQGFPGSPLAFAENYYIHYPKVAIGHWPPVFYAIGAVWMLVFPASVHSLQMFVILIAATLATLLFLAVRSEFGTIYGAAAAVLFVTIPVVQNYASGLMSDMLVALFGFAAMLAWSRFLKNGTAVAATWFGVFTACSILTKGTGLAVAAVPIAGLALSRRWMLLHKRSLWLSTAAVAVVCGGWNLATLRLVVPTMQYELGWRYVWVASRFYSKSVLLAGGLLICVAALIGIWTKVTRGPVEELWASALGLMIGSVVLPSLVPAGLENRYILTGVAPMILLAAAGVDWTAERLRGLAGFSKPVWLAILGAGIAAGFAFGSFMIPPKWGYGFSEAAMDILGRPEFADKLVLCSSDANGEGLLIAELAEREQRPGRIILRASKVLARSDWNGRDYQALFGSEEEILRYLESVRVGVLVIDLMPGPTHFAHQALLERMVEHHPEVWEKAAVYPKTAKGVAPKARVEIYRAIRVGGENGARIDLDMTRTLKKVITIQP